MALRTVVYLRKSDESDEKQIHSIDRQKGDIKSYFEKNARAEKDNSLQCLKCRLEKNKDLFYEVKSAKELKRVAFYEMIKQIKKHKFDVLLVTDLSRLSRNAIDTGIVVQLLEEGHLKEVRTLDKIFTTTPTDKFTLSLFLSVSKFENDQRALNTSSGMGHQRSKGRTMHKAPVGYVNKGDNKGDKWIEKDLNIWNDVKGLWEMLLSESYTITAIYQEALERNIVYRDKKGNLKTPAESTIRSMFRNKYYAGFIKDTDVNGQAIYTKGIHPAMVTEKEFEQVQLILQKNGYKHSKIDKAVDIADILKGIMVSGIHTVKDSKGATVPASILYEYRKRYTCTHCKHRFYAPNTECQKCQTKINKETKINEMKRLSHLVGENKKKKVDSVQFNGVLDKLKMELNRFNMPDRVFELTRNTLYTLWLERNEKFKKNIQGLNNKIAKLEDEKGELFRRKFDSTENRKEDVEIALDKVDEELEGCEETRQKLREKHSETFERSWQSLQVLFDAKNILNTTTEFEPKKKLILSLISNLIIYKDTIEVKWKKPFNQLAKGDIAHIKKGDKNKVYHHSFSFGSPD